ncbi:MAG TPA: OsmC family protein [Polyangiaceae bacterium]|jgi:putative redox protein|nr:OsmC family protein [Polyangiaceae bacterium]
MTTEIEKESEMMKDPEVTVSGPTAEYVQDVSIDDHHFRADEPVTVGGHDEGPDPYGLLLAALGTCTSMTLGWYARQKKLPLQRVTVRLKHSRIHAEDCASCETKVGKLDEIQREIELEGPLDAEQRARLLEMADKCPIHRTLTSEIVIRTQLVESK